MYIPSRVKNVEWDGRRWLRIFPRVLLPLQRARHPVTIQYFRDERCDDLFAHRAFQLHPSGKFMVISPTRIDSRCTREPATRTHLLDISLTGR